MAAADAGTPIGDNASAYVNPFGVPAGRRAYSPEVHPRPVPQVQPQVKVSEPAKAIPAPLEKAPAAPVAQEPEYSEEEPVKESPVNDEPLDEAILEKDILILQPMYKSVDPLVSFAKTILFDKKTMGYATQMGDAMIYHARNHLADIFMKSKSEYCLFWDDDVVPPVGRPDWTKKHVPGVPSDYPEKFLKINPLARLKAHGKTLIGGLYFGRRNPHYPICARSTETLQTMLSAPAEVILPVDWVGTGFLLIHRSVFEAIQKRFPELAPKPNSPNHWERVWGYFQPSEQQAEDVSFCLRAKAAGHQPYVDLSTVVAHVGTTTFGPWNHTKKK